MLYNNFFASNKKSFVAGISEIGDLDTGIGTQTPGSAITQAMEIQQLRAENKALVKENARLKKENDLPNMAIFHETDLGLSDEEFRVEIANALDEWLDRKKPDII